MSSPVICIPRINKNVTKHQLYNIFVRLNWGTVKNISIINTSKNNTSCVFIYLNWKNNDDIKNICEKLSNGKSIKIVYNEYTIWKLYAKK